MKLRLLLVLGYLGFGMPAAAAVVTLQNIIDLGSMFRFDYRATFAPDEGVIAGSKLIIFDFAGYVGGSVYSTNPDLAAATELVTSTPFITPGYTDDPLIENLVFSYGGGDFHNNGGPFGSFDFSGFGADSDFGDSTPGGVHDVHGEEQSVEFGEYAADYARNRRSAACGQRARTRILGDDRGGVWPAGRCGAASADGCAGAVLMGAGVNPASGRFPSSASMSSSGRARSRRSR